MKTKFLTLVSMVTLSASQLTAKSSTLCQVDPTADCPALVPEINALAGIAAVAAISAVLAFFWERSRRA